VRAGRGRPRGDGGGGTRVVECGSFPSPPAVGVGDCLRGGGTGRRGGGGGGNGPLLVLGRATTAAPAKWPRDGRVGHERGGEWVCILRFVRWSAQRRFSTPHPPTISFFRHRFTRVQPSTGPHPHPSRVCYSTRTLGSPRGSRGRAPRRQCGGCRPAPSSAGGRQRRRRPFCRRRSPTCPSQRGRARWPSRQCLRGGAAWPRPPSRPRPTSARGVEGASTPSLGPLGGPWGGSGRRAPATSSSPGRPSSPPCPRPRPRPRSRSRSCARSRPRPSAPSLTSSTRAQGGRACARCDAACA
jgi:hypothetical protein